MTGSTSHQALFDTIAALALRHAPSGVETDIDKALIAAFGKLGVPSVIDAAGNVIARIERPSGAPHSQRRIAITAHKDEIGATVSATREDGRLELRKLGGSFPWIYGEGVVDVLGDRQTIQGVLSFGSRHVSHASPQHVQQESAPLRWSDSWVETLVSAAELEQAGVRPGTPVLVGRHRKQALRLGDHIASYALDNKASLAIMLELAARLAQTPPCHDIFLVGSTREEIGASGALYFASQNEVDALIALEVAPISREYPIKDTDAPVLVAEDNFTLYHPGLNAHLRGLARQIGIDLQMASVNNFGSDASLALRLGHTPRAACLGFATYNTHGFEIARLAAIAACVDVLTELCSRPYDIR